MESEIIPPTLPADVTFINLKTKIAIKGENTKENLFFFWRESNIVNININKTKIIKYKRIYELKIISNSDKYEHAPNKPPLSYP